MDQFTLSYNWRQSKHLLRKDGTYPVQLSVYDKNTFQHRDIIMKFGFTNKEIFDNVVSAKPKEANKEMRKEMDKFISDAENKARTLKIFSIVEFKVLLKKRISVGNTVTSYYENKINDLKDSGNMGTASNYECSINSLKLFRTYQGKPSEFYFHEVTPQFLQQYESYMRKGEKSNSTIGIYLRPLRSILNDARIDNIEISYPFHTKLSSGYKIPGSQKTNKALVSADLKKLFEGIPQNEEQAKAKDFFFFSYLSNGMNVKDICRLRFKDIAEDHFKFVRAKTENTTKERQQIIEVVIMDFHRQTIEKYGNSKQREYVFPILDGRMNPEKKRSMVQSFTRSINKHIKKYAESLGVTSEISSNWARHSYATKMMNDNVSLEFIRQSLGHHNLSTTQNYLSSFESKEKKKNAENLLNF